MGIQDASFRFSIRGQVPMGLLESVPIEYAFEPIKGEKSLFINCMWILPPFWVKSVGRALIESLIKRAKEIGGVNTIVYDGEKWCGTSISYLSSSFFKSFGFKDIERDGSRVLLHLDLGAKIPPELIYHKFKSFKDKKDARFVVFFNCQCPWSKLMINDLNKNTKESPNIKLNILETNDRCTIEKLAFLED